MSDKATFEVFYKSEKNDKFFAFRDVTIENKNTNVHWHNQIEFLCCLSGETGVFYDADVVHIKKGQTIMVNSKSLHYVAPEEGMHLYCLIVNKSFFEENEIDISSLEFEKIVNDPIAYKLMMDIYDVLKGEQDKFLGARKRQAILTYLLHMCQNHTHKKTVDYTKNSKSYTAVREAIEYIDKNLSKKITLEEIAARFNYSKYHFSRLFKDSTGYTLIDHLNKKRVEYAYDLLKDDKNKLSLSAICDKCGFASYSYFSSKFKEGYGVLPSDFKKTQP